MSDFSQQINPIIDSLRKEFDAPFVTAAGKAIGYVELPDGRRAEIQVSLEADTDEWSDGSEADREDERREEEGI